VEKVKSQVLCLPFHSGVDEEDIEDIRAEFVRSDGQPSRGPIPV
jgi:hypothetical protein